MGDCSQKFINAINLGQGAVWRFDGKPRQYCLDWMRVAAEGAYHCASTCNRCVNCRASQAGITDPELSRLRDA